MPDPWSHFDNSDIIRSRYFIKPSVQGEASSVSYVSTVFLPEQVQSASNDFNSGCPDRYPATDNWGSNYRC